MQKNCIRSNRIQWPDHALLLVRAFPGLLQLAMISCMQGQLPASMGLTACIIPGPALPLSTQPCFTDWFLLDPALFMLHITGRRLMHASCGGSPKPLSGQFSTRQASGVARRARPEKLGGRARTDRNDSVRCTTAASWGVKQNHPLCSIQMRQHNTGTRGKEGWHVRRRGR